VGAGFAGGASEDGGGAGGGFHDAGEDLEGGGFSGAVGADEAEDFAGGDGEVDARTASTLDADAPYFFQRSRTLTAGGAVVVASWMGSVIVMWQSGSFVEAAEGKVSPWTRTSPSAGMPGFAKACCAL